MLTLGVVAGAIAAFLLIFFLTARASVRTPPIYSWQRPELKALSLWARMLRWALGTA